jgi:hypothetical protein
MKKGFLTKTVGGRKIEHIPTAFTAARRGPHKP